MQIKFLRHIFFHSKLLWIGIFISSALTSLDGIASPYVIGELTNMLTRRQYSKVPKIIGLYLALFLIITFSYWIWQILWAKARQIANTNMRRTVVNHFLDNPTEDKIEKANNFINIDVKQIENQYINSVVNLVYCIEQALFSLIYVVSINGIVSMTFLICGLIPFIIPRITRKWVESGTKDWNKSFEKYNLTLNESLRSFPVILHFNAISKFKKRINTKLKLEEKKYFKMAYRSSTASFFSQLSYAISTIVALSVGILFVVSGQVSVGGFISLFLASDRLTSPIISISQILNQLNTVNPLIEEFMSLNINKKQIDNLVSINFPDNKKLLKFEKCEFGYGDPLIKSFSLDIDKGEKVLIMGRSGIGKSTIFKTLLNEIPLLSGKILVEDRLENGSFLQNLGIVSQENYIFTDTLEFNLTLGEKFETTEIISVLNQVGLTKFNSKSDLSRMLGKGGITLSGGEKRRLEVARALLSKKNILLVDEAFSGLDVKSAEAVFKVLMDFPGTVIEIEHAIDDKKKGEYDKFIDLNKLENKAKLKLHT